MDKSLYETEIKKIKDQIKKIYLEDEIPWVVGYSGGKDSTAVTQLVWESLEELEPEKRHKAVYIISTDTLVENPVVSLWVRNSLKSLEKEAVKKKLPIYPNLLTPKIENTFWVNLIGRGYPAPRRKFRWCTERLKIKPADEFVNSVVKQNGQAILVLGTRKAESTVRASRIKVKESKSVREHLTPSDNLPNSYIYSPIVEWSNDDVWVYLMQEENPWGNNNKDLLTMYQGATSDGECPLVVDTSTPSCGNSRFGCWVCTLVQKDKSMSAMVQNDSEKEWMAPLLQLRNELDQPDRELRDFRRMSGNVQLFAPKEDYEGPENVPGPYTQDSRAMWLKKLLTIQTNLRNSDNTPEEVKDIELISAAELEEIRRIWVTEKHEIEDLLPLIYEEVVGDRYPGKPIDENQPFSREDLSLLKEICKGNDLHFEMVRGLLETERKQQNKNRRSNLFNDIEKIFKRTFYEDAEDAFSRAKDIQKFSLIMEKQKKGEIDLIETSEEIKKNIN